MAGFLDVPCIDFPMIYCLNSKVYRKSELILWMFGKEFKPFKTLMFF